MLKKSILLGIAIFAVCVSSPAVAGTRCGEDTTFRLTGEADAWRRMPDVCREMRPSGSQFVRRAWTEIDIWDWRRDGYVHRLTQGHVAGHPRQLCWYKRSSGVCLVTYQPRTRMLLSWTSHGTVAFFWRS